MNTKECSCNDLHHCMTCWIRTRDEDLKDYNENIRGKGYSIGEIFKLSRQNEERKWRERQ